MKTLYSHSESCILNNGWASNFFEIQRGVRQGCPLSPYLFILSAEVLATAIRKNTNIKGISVNNMEIKLSQYADDTTLILDGSRESLLSSLAMLDDFSKVSGLRLTQLISESYNNSYNRVKITPRGGVTIFGVEITPKRSYFFL